MGYFLIPQQASQKGRLRPGETCGQEDQCPLLNSHWHLGCEDWIPDPSALFSASILPPVAAVTCPRAWGEVDHRRQLTPFLCFPESPQTSQESVLGPVEAAESVPSFVGPFSGFAVTVHDTLWSPPHGTLQSPPTVHSVPCKNIHPSYNACLMLGCLIGCSLGFPDGSCVYHSVLIGSLDSVKYLFTHFASFSVIDIFLITFEFQITSRCELIR